MSMLPASSGFLTVSCCFYSYNPFENDEHWPMSGTVTSLTWLLYRIHISFMLTLSSRIIFVMHYVYQTFQQPEGRE